MLKATMLAASCREYRARSSSPIDAGWAVAQTEFSVMLLAARKRKVREARAQARSRSWHALCNARLET